MPVSYACPLWGAGTRQAGLGFTHHFVMHVHITTQCVRDTLRRCLLRTAEGNALVGPPIQFAQVFNA